MKATFAFDLPEEQEDFAVYYNAYNYLNICGELHNKLRAMVKHGEYSDEAYQVLEEVYQFLFDTACANGVDL